MAAAAYSGKPLIAKLGYQPGDNVYAYQAPDWFVQYLKDEGILTVSTLPATWAHIFITEQQALLRLADSLDWNNIEKGIWFS